MQIKCAKDLIVYQKAYALAMKILEMRKIRPPETCCPDFISYPLNIDGSVRRSKVACGLF